VTILRPDIQGLRAVAVSMVLVYHLFPHRFTGGFTGVDVFFVISGFLITSHLLAHPPASARDLATFWSRRIRRLLPAASLVLLATLAASRLVAPDTQWANTAAQAKAAALYIVNWRLANDSVDYLAAAAAPSPVQHFWSLSVEEQFYIGWPILILILVALAAWRRWKLIPTVTIGLTIAVGLSLYYSIHETITDPARAYFVTPTRVWELGIGGLLAAALSRRALGRQKDSEAVPLPVGARVVLAWLGLAAILLTGLTYTGATPFPGWKALVPTLGTAAVIAACAPGSGWSPVRVLKIRPVQWLGDISYSVYLWHWPMIVLVPYVSGDHLGRLDKAVIVLLSLILADLTRRFVEDRFRAGSWGRPLFKPFVLGATLMALVAGCATAQVVEVKHRETAAKSALAKARTQPCFGAASFDAPARCPEKTTGALTPTPLQAATDKSDAYHKTDGHDCFAFIPAFAVRTCTFGDPKAKTSVALVGNSHAGQWLPALETLAAQNHWRITTYLASQCAFATTRQNFATPEFATNCVDWGASVAKRLLTGHYNLVVMTNRVSVSAEGRSLAQSWPLYAQGYRHYLAQLSAAHIPVVGIRDTPAPSQPLIPDCLAAHTDDYSQCNGTRAKWLPREPLVEAIAAVHDPHIVLADLIGHICGPVVCPAVAGGVPVYFDGSHMTATYARTLAPYLGAVVRKVLAAA
jgi:peptidoglycan/LPS O-acetylase OafA/YrhL